MKIQDQNYFKQTLKGKPTSGTNTKTQKIREQFKHFVHPIPKDKKQGTSPVKSPIMLRRETSYGLGYHNRNYDTRNQSFQICKSSKII